MIDIEKANKEFLEYVKTYDITIGRIKLKMEHIIHVAEESKKIAMNLGLDEEQVKLAELIGYFHDIGRFEQARLYDTFSDRDTGLDHAAYSLKVLYEDGLIHRFLDTDEYDDIIKKAVFNHNKAKIADDVTGKALLFSKIIRDADKMDIYRVINEDAMEDIFWYKDFDNQDIQDIIIEMYKKDRFVSYKYLKTNADQIVVFYGYVFDFNFPYCLKVIKGKKYLQNFTKRVSETFKSESIDKKVKDVENFSLAYIDEVINSLDVTIRNVRKEDLSAVIDIQFEGWKTAYSNIISKDYLASMNKEEKMKKRLKDYNQNGFIVAEKNGEVVGFCRYVDNNSFSRNVEDIDCELLALYVKPELKNSGIGTKMIEYVKDEFRTKNKHNMILWCLKDNEPSKAFYSKRGGKIVKEKDIEIGDKIYKEVAFLYKI